MATTRQLETLFTDALALPEGTSFPDLAYRSVPQWDSIAHMGLVARLEAAFQVMIDTDDVIDMNSFTACKQILGRYGVTFED